MAKPLISKIIATDSQSANFLKDDLFLLLPLNEFKNTDVIKNKLVILDPLAISIKKSSKMYQYLLEVAKVQRTFNIKYVATGLSITTSDGKRTLIWKEISGGATYPKVER